MPLKSIFRLTAAGSAAVMIAAPFAGRSFAAPSSPLSSFSVEPKELVLTSPRSSARLIITAALKDGSIQDISDQVTIVPLSGLVSAGPDTLHRALKAGLGRVKADYKGRS